MLKNKALVLAKIETTYGTDPTPTGAANAILCESPEYEVLDVKVERKNIKPNFGSNPFVAIGEGQRLSFVTEVKGSGTAGTAPELGTLLRACNFTATTSAGVSNTYTPNSNTTTAESVTLYYYLDGVVHKMSGCRGTVSLTEAKVNQYAKLKFDFTGIYQGIAAASLPTPTFSAVLPPVFKNASFTLDSYAFVIDGISIDIKNEIAKRSSINAATGVVEYIIKERMVTGNMSPEMILPSTKDIWTMWSGSTTAAFTMTIGSSAGNRCVITAPAVQVDKPKYGDRDGIVTADMPLVFTPTSAGNDEIVFTFT